LTSTHASEIQSAFGDPDDLGVRRQHPLVEPDDVAEQLRQLCCDSERLHRRPAVGGSA
jgi:hypothetical protein